MSKLLLEQVAKHRKEIKHEVITYGLSELITMQRQDEIKIRPDYQRLFRWNRDQQSLFIESLLLEIPIPPIFFYENQDGQWELLDGLQRLSTVIKFMGNDADVPEAYRDNDDEWHDKTQNTLEDPLQLTKTDYLTELEGFSYHRLPSTLQLNLKRSRLQIYVLKRETDASYKYEVFKRLNTTGARLEDQEIRNCATRILSDKFPDFLSELGRDQNFRDALQLDDDEVRSLRTDELALRFLTMKNQHSVFKHDVAELLTEYMEQVASGKVEFDYEVEKSLFDRTWKTIATAIPDGKIYRPKKGGLFSPTVYEIVALSVAFNIDKAEQLKPEELRTKLEAIVAEAKTEGITGAGSNSKRKTLGRVQKARANLAA
jgi:hypothetical protein